MRHGQVLVQDTPENLLATHGASTLEQVFLLLCKSVVGTGRVSEHPRLVPADDNGKEQSPGLASNLASTGREETLPLGVARTSPRRRDGNMKVPAEGEPDFDVGYASGHTTAGSSTSGSPQRSVGRAPAERKELVVGDGLLLPPELRDDLDIGRVRTKINANMIIILLLNNNRQLISTSTVLYVHSHVARSCLLLYRWTMEYGYEDEILFMGRSWSCRIENCYFVSENICASCLRNPPLTQITSKPQYECLCQFQTPTFADCIFFIYLFKLW